MRRHQDLFNWNRNWNWNLQFLSGPYRANALHCLQIDTTYERKASFKSTSQEHFGLFFLFLVGLEISKLCNFFAFNDDSAIFVRVICRT